MNVQNVHRPFKSIPQTANKEDVEDIFFSCASSAIDWIVDGMFEKMLNRNDPQTNNQTRSR